MPRLTRIALLAVAAVLAGIPAPAQAQDGPTVDAARGCRVQSRGLGPTYVTGLRVRGTSCANGVKLIRSYHKCRFGNGGRRGRCRGVLGYRCSESRRGIRTQFDGRVNCGKGGGRRISHTYTQFT